ncbi:MAG: DUF6515 family protein [Bacteroidota bacterium]
MKNINSVLFAMAFLFLSNNQAQSQVVRSKRSTVVVDNGNKHKVRRKVRRKRRRFRRTLRRLPVSTRHITFRKVNYYPVNGVYYISRGGIYVRTLPPRGFRVAVLTGRVIQLSVRGQSYSYVEGIFYKEVDNEYEIVAPPTGAVVDELPDGVEEVLIEDITAYELYDTLYRETDTGYEVIGTKDGF